MPQTALYPTVKRFLEELGCQVKGEVNGCDIVAVRDAEPARLAIVEMKRGFNLDLLLQAIDRIGRPMRSGSPVAPPDPMPAALPCPAWPATPPQVD